MSQILFDAGLYPLFPADLDEMGDWHGHPLPRWLFPARLTPRPVPVRDAASGLKNNLNGGIINK